MTMTSGIERPDEFQPIVVRPVRRNITRLMPEMNHRVDHDTGDEQEEKDAQPHQKHVKRIDVGPHRPTPASEE